jgi:DNA-binding beta-propeller fold protein YncE
VADAGRCIGTRKHLLLLLFLLVAATVLWATGAVAGPISPTDLSTMSSFTGEAPAPEFPVGLHWLNVARPLTMKELSGKVVLLDFWSFGCINCQHALADLARLQAKYGDGLAVIGVHAPKFEEEQDPARLREAVLRLGIHHPVMNDTRLLLWRAYSLYAWPTVVLISPEGTVVGLVSGEGSYDVLDRAVGAVMRAAEEKAPLNTTPLPLQPERDGDGAATLSKPGKVLAEEGGERLFIADTNHNRIVVASRQDGAVLATIGSGAAGLRDGSFETAEFARPQGLALKGADTLYVADTDNHAIREVDLRARTVKTVAGRGHGTAPDSPWDLVVSGNGLYIAMAGAHQIWRMDLDSYKLEAFAGSGREAMLDGARDRAALAQPLGIAANHVKLYIADSESSAIRSVDINGRARVETVAGGGLFEFGDRDGPGKEARLQYPMAVAYRSGELYVADTYNHKIKRISIDGDTAETWVGTGEAGLRDGARAEFDEPSGLSVAGDKLYIADRGNDAIRVADLRTGAVETLALRTDVARAPAPPEFAGRVVELPAQTVAPGTVMMALSLEAPVAAALDAEAPNEVTVRVEGEPAEKGSPIEKTVANPTFPLRVWLRLLPGRGAVRADVRLHYRGSEAGSTREETRIIVPVMVEKASQTRTVTVAVPQ